ncbi:TPA: hypothetical protein ACVU5P_004205 [Vibrio parahaemolyticus]
MTKSEIFKTAHEMARGTVKAVGNYMIAFSLALKEIRTFLKTARPVRAPLTRANRFGKRSFVTATFTASHVATFIKENSRIVREFATLAAYNEARETGNLGSFWNNDEYTAFLAYEYF